MVRFGGSVMAALAMCALIMVLSGCKENEGPAEGAGRKVDEAVGEAGKQVEEAGEEMQDVAEGDDEE
jgi:hypothetical protein